MKKRKLAVAAAIEAIERQQFAQREYADASYSVLTITFAEGSDPQQVSIPYRPWANRTDVTLPLRVTKAD